GARILVAEHADGEQDDRVDDIILGRKHRAVEKGMVDEAHADAEQQQEDDEGGYRPPGLGTGAAGHPRRAAAQQTGDEEELPDRWLFVEDTAHLDLLRLNACRLRDRRRALPDWRAAPGRCRSS